jgi:hypothetical protein
VTVEACAVKFVVVRDNMDEGVAAGGAFLSLCARSDHPAVLTHFLVHRFWSHTAAT